MVSCSASTLRRIQIYRASSERENPSEILSQENQGSLHRSVSVFLFSELGRFVYPSPLMIASQLPLSLRRWKRRETVEEITREFIINVHKELMENVDSRIGFRRTDIRVTRSRFKPGPGKYVLTDINLFLKFLNL